MQPDRVDPLEFEHHENDQDIEEFCYIQQSLVNSQPFSIISIALLAVYPILVVSEGLPIRLLDPVWQLRACELLVDNAAIPLVGLSLSHLAAYLDPANPWLQARRARLARLAIAAVIGFLLLIPLYIGASWNGSRTIFLNQETLFKQANRGIYVVRQAISIADSPQDLQRRLQTISGRRISDSDINLPFAQLKQRLLKDLRQAEEKIKGECTQSLAPRTEFIWKQVNRSSRMSLLALAFAMGFSAAAQRKDSEHSLFQEWLATMAERHHERHRRAEEGLSTDMGPRSDWADSEYFESIVSPEDDSPKA